MCGLGCISIAIQSKAPFMQIVYGLGKERVSRMKKQCFSVHGWGLMTSEGELEGDATEQRYYGRQGNLFLVS